MPVWVVFPAQGVAAEEVQVGAFFLFEGPGIGDAFWIDVQRVRDVDDEGAKLLGLRIEEDSVVHDGNFRLVMSEHLNPFSGWSRTAGVLQKMGVIHR